MNAHPRLRVLLVDDTDEIRNLVRVVLGTDTELDVVGEARNGAEALEMVKAVEPDVVLLDWQMPVLDGLRAIPGLRRERPGVGIVMYSSRVEADASASALAAGADAYLEKTAELSEVTRRLREVGAAAVTRREARSSG